MSTTNKKIFIEGQNIIYYYLIVPHRITKLWWNYRIILHYDSIELHILLIQISVFWDYGYNINY